MTASKLFEAGDLSAAMTATIEEVKQRPADLALRTLLFELLCFQGDFDRAEKHLDVVGQQDVQTEWAVQVYRNILAAERNRRRLWSDGVAPEFLLDPPEYAQLQLKAVNRLREGQSAAALALLEQSESLRPVVMARRGDQPAGDFRDCDDVLAPILELIILRDYVWLPLTQVRELEIGKPERPRDLIWIPVRVVLEDESQRRGYMPVLYPGTHKHPDDKVKLGRVTDWSGDEGCPVRGVGQKTFLCGDQDFGLLDLGQVTFEVQL